MAGKGSTIHYLANKYLVSGLLTKVPWLGSQIRGYLDLKEIARACGYRPGHYYSPIPSREEVNSRADSIFSDSEVLDIDLNLENQFQLLEKFVANHSEFPYDLLNGHEREDLRYRFLNRPQYRYSDVVFLYHVMRYVRPKKVVEVGSGASSAVMLDINDLFFDSTITFTFVEPYPQRLYGFLTENDRQKTTVLEEKVQDIQTDIFELLDENDILFIDSSHVSKIGSDVNHLFFHILPRLKKGVWIHFHDIYYPFEMPVDWVLKNGRFWNESYLLRAFLMNNESYKIKLFNSLLHKRYSAWLEKEMPECLIDEGNSGSIWIAKR